MADKLSRRDFLRSAASVFLGAGLVLSGCGGGDDSPQPGSRTTPKPPAAAKDPCNDLSGLTETDLATRKTFQYVAQTPDPAKVCTNCALWQVPAEGQFCGGCTLVKGPINPKGYCNSWVAMQPAQSG